MAALGYLDTHANTDQVRSWCGRPSAESLASKIDIHQLGVNLNGALNQMRRSK